MGDPLAIVLVVAAFVLLIFQGISLLWTAALSDRLAGRPGGQLMLLFLVTALAIFFGQLLALIRTVLILVAPEETLETRIGLFLLEEITIISASAFVTYRAYKLQANVDQNGALTEWSEPAERVGVEVDDSTTWTGAPVHELDPDAVGGTDLNDAAPPSTSA